MMATAAACSKLYGLKRPDLACKCTALQSLAFACRLGCHCTDSSHAGAANTPLGAYRAVASLPLSGEHLRRTPALRAPAAAAP